MSELSAVSFHIRQAELADSDAIATIYNYYIQNTIITFEEEIITSAVIANRMMSIAAKTLPWLVLTQDNSVQGYAYAGHFHSRSAYRYSVESTIYLAHDKTNQGLGQPLYQALLADLAIRPVRTVIAGIALPNMASVALHERLGFGKVAHYHEVGWKLDRWIDVGYWQLMLTDGLQPPSLRALP